MASRSRQKRHEKKVKKMAKQLLKEKRAAEKEAKREARKSGVKTAAAASDSGRKRSFLRTFVTALIVFVILFVPLGIAINNFLDTNPFATGDEEEEVKFEVLVNPESPFFAEFSDSKRVNVLVLGVNYPLADTIMLGSFDPVTKRADIISIPRDTYYYRAEYADAHAYLKINSVFHQGVEEMAKAVSDVLLGIPINYYAVVEYADIAAIVDEMGGVPMYIEQDMYYEDYWDTTLDPNGLVIDFKAGQQTLNGIDSIKFLRFRSGYAMGDIGRIEAQQAWLRIAISAALDHGIMKCAEVAFEEIDSNFTYKAMISLGTKALGMEAENISTYTIPHTLQQEAPYFVYPDTAGIEELLRSIYTIVPETTSDGAITDGAVTE